MTVPSTMADLSVSASGNSPDGSVDPPSALDDNIRAVAAIVRRTQARGAAIASASTVNIGATTDGEFVHITGTATISSFGTVAAGVERTLVFDGALTLTHSSNLLCPYLTSFTTTAGDVMTWRSEGSGVWKCVSHLPAASSSERDRLGLGTAATATVGTGSTDLTTNVTVDTKISTGLSSLTIPNPITNGTAVSSTSGVAIDFTAIPSWVKLVKLMLDQVSTSGSSAIIVQIGDSGGIEISGYSGSSQLGSGAYGPHTNGLNIFPANAAANVISGVVTIALLSSGVYSMASALGASNSGGMAMAAASKTLSSAPMDRIRITTAGGTDTFDGGSINILYE